MYNVNDVELQWGNKYSKSKVSVLAGRLNTGWNRRGTVRRSGTFLSFSFIPEVAPLHPPPEKSTFQKEKDVLNSFAIVRIDRNRFKITNTIHVIYQKGRSFPTQPTRLN